MTTIARWSGRQIVIVALMLSTLTAVMPASAAPVAPVPTITGPLVVNWAATLKK